MLLNPKGFLKFLSNFQFPNTILLTSIIQSNPNIQPTLPLSTIYQDSSSFSSPFQEKSHKNNKTQKFLFFDFFKTSPSTSSPCPMEVEEILPSNPWPPHASKTNEN